jgi:glutathione synthase/RimK-type ligase-like ATP-grasp enzyme
MQIQEPHAGRHVLLITSKNDLSADLLVTELRKRGVSFLRLNLEDFPIHYRASWSPDVQGHSLVIDEHEWPLSTFKSAWYRRTVPPSLPSTSAVDGVLDFLVRETTAFLEGIWETNNWVWMNRPSAVRRAENKLAQLALAKHCHFSIPDTLVTNDARAARRFLQAHDSAIVKSIATSSVEIDGKRAVLFTHGVTEKDILADSALQLSPCIFQRRLRKRSDIRITLVASSVFAAEISTREAEANDIDWRSVAPERLTYAAHVLPKELVAACRRYLDELGLIYGCFDFVLTPEGEYVFLELNPSGQWGWIEHEIGAAITEAIVRVLTQEGK